MGYVILPGKAGTLAELSQLWAMQRAGCLAGRPVVLLGNDWHFLVEELSGRRMLEPSQLRSTHLVSGPREAVRTLATLLSEDGDRA